MNNISHRETYQAGDYIFHEHTPSMAAYMIENGEVEVLKEFQGKMVRVATLSKGDIFGEMGVLGRIPHIASVRAKTEVKLGTINKQAFLADFGKMQHHNQKMILALIQRLRITTEKMTKLTVQNHQLKTNALPVEEKVA